MTESTYCVFQYTCGFCGEEFAGLAKGDHAYGELTARSAGTGQLIYINALADPVFNEVERLATEVLTETGLNPSSQRRGVAVQRAYSASCDPCEDGTPFVVGGHPPCPGCGAARPRAWEHTGEHQVRNVPEATHQHWLTLTPQQRRAHVREEIVNSLSG